jgi:hypothetical protein
MSKKHLFNPEKHTPKHRKEFIEEWSEFYLLELWDRNLVETLLDLDVEDDELADVFSAIEWAKEKSFYEGYEEARASIREVLTGDEPLSYSSRQAVRELDED